MIVRCISFGLHVHALQIDPVNRSTFFHCTLEEKVILHSLNASHREKQSTQSNYRSLRHRISSSREAGKISVRSIPENKTIGIHPKVFFLWSQNQS